MSPRLFHSPFTPFTFARSVTRSFVGMALAALTLAGTLGISTVASAEEQRPGFVHPEPFHGAAWREHRRHGEFGWRGYHRGPRGFRRHGR